MGPDYEYPFRQSIDLSMFYTLPGSAPGPTLGTEYGKILPLPILCIVSKRDQQQQQQQRPFNGL